MKNNNQFRLIANNRKLVCTSEVLEPRKIKFFPKFSNFI